MFVNQKHDDDDDDDEMVIMIGMFFLSAKIFACLVILLSVSKNRQENYPACKTIYLLDLVTGFNCITS